MKTYIKEWMDTIGMSIDSLSNEISISPKIIQKWVDGKVTPSLAQMVIVSDAMHVPMEKLVLEEPGADALWDNPEGEEPKKPSVEEEKTDNIRAFDPGKKFVLKIPLKEWMEFRRVTREMVSTATGIPQDVIAEWEENISNPSIFQAAAISDLLRVPLDDMITRTPKEYFGVCFHKHIFETKFYSTAVRLQKWLNRKKIENTVTRVIGNKESIYMISYSYPEPITQTKALVIILNPKNWDIREYMPLDAEDKYKDIDTIYV